jgi:Fe-S oxidoreductase
MECCQSISIDRVGNVPSTASTCEQQIHNGIITTTSCCGMKGVPAHKGPQHEPRTVSDKIVSLKMLKFAASTHCLAPYHLCIQTLLLREHQRDAAACRETQTT